MVQAGRLPAEQVDPRGEGYEISQLAAAQHLHNKRGLMPIHIAAGRGNAPVCEALLKAGAPINARSSERTRWSTATLPPSWWGRRNKNGELTAVEVADKTPLHVAVGLLRDQHEMDDGAASFDTTLVRLLPELRCGLQRHRLSRSDALRYRRRLRRHARAGGHAGRRRRRSEHELQVVWPVLVQHRPPSGDAPQGCSDGQAAHRPWCARRRHRPRWLDLPCLAARSAAEVAKALLAAGADVFAVSGNGKHALEIALINCKNSKTVRESGVLEVLQREVAAAVLEIVYHALRDRSSWSEWPV